MRILKKRRFERFKCGCKIILKWILKTYGGRLCTELIRVRILEDGGLF
jgi:hypothetical protein